MNNIILEYNYYLHALLHNNTYEEKQLTKVMVKNHFLSFIVFNSVVFLGFYSVKNTYGVLYRLTAHCLASGFAICLASFYNSRLLHMHVLLSRFPCEYFIIKSKSKLMGDFIDGIDKIEIKVSDKY